MVMGSLYLHGQWLMICVAGVLGFTGTQGVDMMLRVLGSGRVRLKYPSRGEIFMHL